MKLYTKTIPGSDVKVYLRENSSDEALFKVLVNEDEYGYIAFERTPKIIVDAGANIGLASVQFAMKYPEATIYSIEPEDENFEMLKKNTETYSNIKPIQAALMNYDGSGTVLDIGEGDLAYQIGTDMAEGIQSVKCVSITSLCEKNSISQIDLLKIDIEGAEKEIFSGDCSWLDSVSVLIIELHERYKAGCNEAVFNAIRDKFDMEWIGGENFYFVKNQMAKPAIPVSFKVTPPQSLPIERVWALQSELNSQNVERTELLVPVWQRIAALEELYKRVDALEGLYRRTDALEGLYKRMDTLEGLYKRVDTLEELYKRVDTLEGLYKRVDALEELYKRVDTLEGCYSRIDSLEGLYNRVDVLEKTSVKKPFKK